MSEERALEPTPAATEDDPVAGELRELTRSVAELRAELRRAAGATLPRDETAGWDDETPRTTQAWVSALAPPRPALRRVPRLPFELAFIAAAAALAGVADLRPVEIAAVMAAAWLIVALAEWAGSRGDRLRWQVYLSPVVAPEPAVSAPPDPSWFTPPVEHTLFGPRDDQATAVVAAHDEQATAVGAPAAATATQPPGDDPEATAERRPEP